MNKETKSRGARKRKRLPRKNRSKRAVVRRVVRRKPLPRSRLHYRHLRELRRWWHEILRTEGRYRCYAFFLVLPSDEEATRYLMDFDNELDILSGENCLVIILGEKMYRCVGSGENVWGKAVKEYIEQGYSSQVGQLFKIDFSQFPCFILFNDIRSSEHIVISLKEMNAEAIAEKLRHEFSTIQQAVTENGDPLIALARKQRSEDLQEAGKVALRKIRSIADSTFEVAMEAWIRALVNA